MYEQAKGDTSEGGRKKSKKDEVKVSLFEALQVLIEHGHDKNKLLNEYSREELALFYEKCVRVDTLKDARMIENLMCGIGGAFSGGKEVKKLLKTMRE